MPPSEQSAATRSCALRDHDCGALIMAAALIPAAFGAAALAGWMTGVESLKRLDSSLVAMNPLTACCLIATGLALAAHRLGLRTLGAALGALIALAPLAKLAGLEWGGAPLDGMLFAAALDEPGGYPNRMAPNTAVALILAGAALMLARNGARWAQLATQALGIAVLMAAMFAVTGYLFGIRRLNTVAPFIPMALPTGLALLAAGAAIVALGRDTGLSVVLHDHGPAGTLARRLLPLAVVTPLAVGTARLWGEKSGYYGAEAGVAIMIVANVLATIAMLVATIFALHRTDCIRRQREEALRRSEHFNRTINEASADCVSLLDLDGNVVFANDAAVRAHGLRSVAELVGRPWGHGLDEARRAETDAALAAAREGGVGRLLAELPARGGGVRWFESLFTTLSEPGGRPVSLLVMSRDVTRQKRVEDQVRWAATHDGLTALPNRALFQTRLDRLGELRGVHSFALLLLDLDHFKQVNDTLGHDAGDALLRTVAERLRQTVREGDFVARLGGDEFAILLDGIATNEALTAAADAILDALREPWLYDGRMSDCRVSIGASIALPDHESASELLKKADIALYAAKLRGRGRLAIYKPDMGAEMQRRSSEISLAREALHRGLIQPSYQPKVELKTGKLVGFEALLRWRHPSRGMQEPASLAAAFEDVELAREITDRMLTCMMSDMRRWLNAGVEFGHVAVNAAAADFKQKDFAERLLDRLESAKVPAARLQLEVTETVFLGRGAEYVERALKALSAAGVKIALDDFGTGYASLSHLKQFPVDVVKIDQSFLRDITDPHNAAIVRTVVSLGRSLDLAVVAEGVETHEQEEWLISEGCAFGQGFLYGKAAPAAQVPRLVKAGRGRVRMAA